MGHPVYVIVQCTYYSPNIGILNTIKTLSVFLIKFHKKKHNNHFRLYNKVSKSFFFYTRGFFYNLDNMVFLLKPIT